MTMGPQNKKNLGHEKKSIVSLIPCLALSRALEMVQKIFLGA